MQEGVRPNPAAGRAVYVRSRRQPETIEVQTQTEMRELLDLATEKAVAKFVRIATHTGIRIGGTEESTDEAQFLEEREKFFE
jgi:hypothetical protein